MRTEGPGATRLRAGVARVDITNRRAQPVNDPLYARALVVTDGETTLILVTVDAVAIAEIGTIPNAFLENVRARLHHELNLQPVNLVINASHCHGIVCDDIEDRVVRAVAEACEAIEPVRVGAGVGHEDRITENRRVKLADGGEADVRRAYALVADQEVVGVGPVDTEIGILRLDRDDGRPLAVVYNFAIHPILGVPNGGNTADVTGFASTVIEENLGDGVVALFVQGCAGDINPIFHKIADHFRNAEPIGSRRTIHPTIPIATCTRR